MDDHLAYEDENLCLLFALYLTDSLFKLYIDFKPSIYRGLELLEIEINSQIKLIKIKILLET